MAEIITIVAMNFIPRRAILKGHLFWCRFFQTRWKWTNHSASQNGELVCHFLNGMEYLVIGVRPSV